MSRDARAIVLGCVVLAGCAALVGIESTSDVTPGNPEGGSPEGAPGDANADSGDDSGDQLGDTDGDIPLPPGDSGATDDAGDPIIGDAGPDASACNPVSTFIPVTGATGTVCNPNNILPNTPASTGLDYNYTDNLGTIDGKSAASCVGANFPKPLTHVVVRAAAVGKACDVPCGGGECGTGHNTNVYVGSAGVFKYAGSMALTSAYANFDVAIPASVVDPTQVVVCRSGYGMGRDDVAVSSVVGICKD